MAVPHYPPLDAKRGRLPLGLEIEPLCASARSDTPMPARLWLVLLRAGGEGKRVSVNKENKSCVAQVCSAPPYFSRVLLPGRPRASSEGPRTTRAAIADGHLLSPCGVFRTSLAFCPARHIAGFPDSLLLRRAPIWRSRDTQMCTQGSRCLGR